MEEGAGGIPQVSVGDEGEIREEDRNGKITRGEKNHRGES